MCPMDNIEFDLLSRHIEKGQRFYYDLCHSIIVP